MTVSVNVGEMNPSARLTWEQVRIIREKFANGEASQRQLAKQFHVHWTTVHAIINNRTWRARDEHAS